MINVRTKYGELWFYVKGEIEIIMKNFM